MSRLATDMTGQRFGRLVVTHRVANTKDGKARWHCQCDCGQTKEAIGANLRFGSEQSCGCLRVDLAKQPRVTVRRERLDRYTPLDAVLDRKTVRVARALLRFDGVTCYELLDAMGIDTDSASRGPWYMALGYMARGGYLARDGVVYRITPAGREWLAKQLARADVGVATDAEAEEAA